MRTLRIFDRDPTSGRLLGLEFLLGALLRLGLVATSDVWVVSQGAWGYGVWVCELEDRLEGRADLEVSPPDLIRALDQGEYFYDVAITFSSEPSIKGGLMDSSFLYVEASEAAIATVAAEFTLTGVGAGG